MPKKGLIRWLRVVVGVALVWGALGILGYRLGWEQHARNGQQALLKSARHLLTPKNGSTTCGADPTTPTADGQLTGVLEIPALNVTAPVEEGTGDEVLNVAVGHADSTPLPGSTGTSVLLAHDVSYFADIDQLKPGDVLEYEAGCLTYEFEVTAHQVVAAGSPVPELSGSSLVLDTCWPTNALWYTPDRYLVEAAESKAVPSVELSASGSAKSPPAGATRALSPHASSLPLSIVPPTSWETQYTTPAPPALVAQGLELTQNEYPMGTLQLTGSPSPAWEQSPGPLAVEAGALEAFFGAMHAAAEGQSNWWQDVAPGVVMPAALDDAWVSSHDAPLNVTIAASGDTATSVILDTVVTLSGGAAPGEYHEQVSESIKGSTVVISDWEVENA